MDLDVYLFLMREAFISEQMETEAGREYLEKCWISEQTKPDRDKIREKFRRKGE